MKYMGQSYEELSPSEEANFGKKWKISFFCTVSALDDHLAYMMNISQIEKSRFH